MAEFYSWIREKLTGEDEATRNRYNNTYKSSRIVGRGTLVADPKEVCAYLENDTEYLKKGKDLVNKNKRNMRSH